MFRKILVKDFLEINPKAKILKNQNVPYVGMDDIVIGKRYVTSNKFREYKGGTRFQGGDTLFARITPCLENGKIAQYKSGHSKNAFGSTEFFVFRGKEGISNSNFIYYLCLTDLIRNPAIKSMTGASGRQRADIDVISQLEINAPDLATQNKIATVLSAYDDLIENNLRRISILEDMAKTIFDEWFVKFKYPGYKKVKTIESELGMLPEGWSIEKISSVVAVNPSLKVDKNRPKPYVEMAGLSNNSMLIECSASRTTNSGSKFQNGDTLFARITPCLENGKTGYVQFMKDEEIGIGSTEFIVFRSVKLAPEYVYLLARTDNFRGIAIKSMTGASGRQRVQNDCFDEIMIPVPPKDVLNSFSDTVAPMFKQIQVLANKNRNLRRTRDLLLPKLISGELDVENLDIDIGGDDN